jgi:olefin beta-lactone synthetase
LQKCAERFEHTKSIHTFLLTDCFPMDPRHNSKINREKLAVWADKKLGPHWKGGPA